MKIEETKMKRTFEKKAFVILAISFTLIILSAAVRGEVINKTDSNSVAEFQNTGEVYKFMYSYSGKPQPNRLVPALKTILKDSKIMEKGNSPEALQFTGFFGFAVKDELNIIEEYKNLFAPASHNQRLFILKILPICGNKQVEEYFRTELKKGRFINQQAAIRWLLKEGMPQNLEKLTKFTGQAGKISLLAGQFYATGKREAIEEITGLLDKDENTRTAARETLEKMSKQNPEILTICRQQLQSAQSEQKAQIERLIDNITGKISDKRITENILEREIVTGPKAWALGCGAVLMERNGVRHDTLATCPIAKPGIAGLRKLLDEWWGIRTKKDLLDILSWLEKEGHRKGFDRTVANVASLSNEQFEAVMNNPNYDKETLQELQIARKYGKKLGRKSITAWDYSRYIFLCREGYTLGLLSEEEAWDKIMPAAGKLQKTFNSWEELGCNYLIGRQYWSYKQTVDNGELYDDAVQRLMDMPSSPWNKYPWNMNLSEDANE